MTRRISFPFLFSAPTAIVVVLVDTAVWVVWCFREEVLVPKMPTVVAWTLCLVVLWSRLSIMCACLASCRDIYNTYRDGTLSLSFHDVLADIYEIGRLVWTYDYKTVLTDIYEIGRLVWTYDYKTD